METRSSKQKQKKHKMKMIPPLAAKRQKAGKGKELRLDENEPRPTGNEYDKREENTRKRDMLIRFTEGFYIGHWRFNEIKPVVCDFVELSKEDPVAIAAAKIAIYFFNFDRVLDLKNGVVDYVEHFTVDFVELVRVNQADMVYFLTIKVLRNNNIFEFYEAKVCLNLKEYSKVLYVRRAVHYPKVDRELLKYDAPGAPDGDYAPAEN